MWRSNKFEALYENHGDAEATSGSASLRCSVPGYAAKSVDGTQNPFSGGARPPAAITLVL